MKRPTFVLATSIDDCVGKHIYIYNENHKKYESWGYEYSDVQEVIKDNWSVREFKELIDRERVIVMEEVEYGES